MLKIPGSQAWIHLHGAVQRLRLGLSFLLSLITCWIDAGSAQFHAPQNGHLD
jgi:hypothetical protein